MKHFKLGLAIMSIAFIPTVATASTSNLVDKLLAQVKREKMLLEAYKNGDISKHDFRQSYASLNDSIKRLQQKIDNNTSN